MPTIDRRIERLETAFPARCPRCKAVLTCETCQDWRDEALRYGLDPEVLVDRVRRKMEATLSGRSHDPFLSYGYDLNRLTVTELKTLRALLSKAGGMTDAEATP
jgi:hypothetical protein